MGTVAIAALRTKILAVLDDAAQTQYTSDQIDQAVRDALAEYTKYCPIAATFSFDADGEQVLVLPASFTAFNITDLYKDDGTNPRYHYQFTAEYIDEQWSISPVVVDLKPTSYTVSTTNPLTIPDNTALMAVYSKVNTIDGLDSAAGTTIPDAEIENFAIGAAGFALFSRASGRSEDNNLDNTLVETLKTLADNYLGQFAATLRMKDKSFVTANWKLDTDRAY
jgi:hypothetical protein